MFSNYRPLLSPPAYSETIVPSLRLAQSSRAARRIGWFLLVLLGFGILLVAMAPWQQNVRATGNVIAYAPHERQQVLESPIRGRIIQFGEGIVENARVSKGQLIAEVADIDEGYLGRLEQQLDAATRQVEAARELLAAEERNLEAARTIVTSYEAQVAAYELVKEQVVAAADASIASAQSKVEAEEQKLAEQRAALEQVQADFVRQRTLFEENIVSQLSFQEAERRLREAEAKVAAAEANVEAAQHDLTAEQNTRAATEQRAQAQIDSTNASLRSANSDVAQAESKVAKAQSDLTKAETDLLQAETQVARQRNQLVVAPFAGFITQITPNQGSRILKEGDPICVIVPDTEDRAVQLWLDGNDAPLVEPGRHVRLQFEGWPAVQFAGWPSVAVGTFGGTIVSVDATDDGQGKFRVLVLPDDADANWPSQRFLRQGVRANGWVLLDRVPLWYELWRRMNGFPPVVSTEEPTPAVKKK